MDAFPATAYAIKITAQAFLMRDQANLDGDAFGDACDSDIDGDGTDNAFDAFPNDATESADNDADNIGDNSDNCINDANADQANLDGDALGDACDPDMDGDGVANVYRNTIWW